jgi:hypothetical protein
VTTLLERGAPQADTVSGLFVEWSETSGECGQDEDGTNLLGVLMAVMMTAYSDFSDNMTTSLEPSLALRRRQRVNLLL